MFHLFLDPPFPIYLIIEILLESDRIAKALSSCSASTGDIISTTERLKQELEVTTQKQEIASYFLRDYQLTPQEVNFQPSTLFVSASILFDTLFF